jgi:alpha-D-xyloside xylohydrolase
VLNLTRSGWLGIQKYGAVLWSGDISARWEVLKGQIAEGLNMAMCGIPWWTFDIGGFFVVRDNWKARGCGRNTDPTPLWFWNGAFENGLADDEFKEFYVRCLQFACFLPMMRSHGTDFPREIWQFGEPGTPYYDAIAKFIRLREKLLPYIYSIAADSVLNDTVMMRSLLFDFPDDEIAAGLSGEYMFGPVFLVCPVTKSINNEKHEKDGGCFLWPCYLPAGAEWVDYWTGDEYDGGQWINVPTPLDSIPLFIRKGATFTLYEDAGDGYAYERGEFTCTQKCFQTV